MRSLPYSLGDAIDWKPERFFSRIKVTIEIPYSLGDAIDWKQPINGDDEWKTVVPYSLGDAIDWKLLKKLFVLLVLK